MSVNDDVLAENTGSDDSALSSVAMKLEQHMKSCIMNKVNQGAQEEAMEELLVTFQRN